APRTTRHLHYFPTRRSSDLRAAVDEEGEVLSPNARLQSREERAARRRYVAPVPGEVVARRQCMQSRALAEVGVELAGKNQAARADRKSTRLELQSLAYLVCR